MRKLFVLLLLGGLGYFAYLRFGAEASESWTSATD